MPSPNTPAPDFRRQVLEATLTEVRGRRRHRAKRHQALASLATVIIVVIVTATTGTPWWKNARLEPQPTAFTPKDVGTAPSSLIEWLPVDRPLRFFDNTGSRQSLVTRVPPNQESLLETFEHLTDDQLLASLPPYQPAGIVQDPDGRTRLIFVSEF